MKSGWLKVVQDEFQELEQSSIKLRDITDQLRRNCFPSGTEATSISKNRYPDILPFENTRVRLQGNASEGSDYINANFLLNKKYISCQAPIFPTLADFWRMVWEQHSIVVVMLTKLQEAGRTKANIYWPVYLNSTLSFGDLSVTLVEDVLHEHFQIRCVILRKGDESRQVFHLHYTEWPDYGVPKLTRGILCLCKQINELGEADIEAPIIVHCSAGIGRSGSFVAIHHILNQIDQGLSYDVLATAKQLRRERIGMIQTEEQYRLIHQTIKDYSRANIRQSIRDDNNNNSSNLINKSWSKFSLDKRTLVTVL